MIYQLYYKNTNTSEFGDLYKKLDLSSISDPIYLPQIENEYPAMVYLWQNELDQHDWIGFTSHRQLEKGFNTILKNTDEEINQLLKSFDILTWGWLCMNDTRAVYNLDPNVKNVIDQMNFYHSNLSTKMNEVLKFYSLPSVESVLGDVSCALYANYWIMSKDNFKEFMSWSYPLALWLLNNPRIYNPHVGHFNDVGLIIERLFIYWYNVNQKINIKIL